MCTLSYRCTRATPVTDQVRIGGLSGSAVWYGVLVVSGARSNVTRIGIVDVVVVAGGGGAVVGATVTGTVVVVVVLVVDVDVVVDELLVVVLERVVEVVVDDAVTATFFGERSLATALIARIATRISASPPAIRRKTRPRRLPPSSPAAAGT